MGSNSKAQLQNEKLVEDRENAILIPISPYVTLSDEELIEFFNNWNLVTAYALLDIEGFKFNPMNLSLSLNILKNEAETIIETLNEMGLIKSKGLPDEFVPLEIRVNDEQLSSSDILKSFVESNKIVLSKLSSRDIFGFSFDALSKSVILKYTNQVNDLLAKMVQESRGANDLEVYAVSYSFTKASKINKRSSSEN